MIESNPKDLAGQKKPNLSLLPPVASAHIALAMMDGAIKYNAWNWREKPISLLEYIAAIKRHCDDILAGETFASDSGILHLAHIGATTNILIDAYYAGVLKDDRPKFNDEIAKGMDAAEQFVKDILQPRIMEKINKVKESEREPPSSFEKEFKGPPDNRRRVAFEFLTAANKKIDLQDSNES